MTAISRRTSPVVRTSKPKVPSVLRDGTYPFQLTRRTKPEFGYRYAARLVVEDGVASLQISKSQTHDNFEVWMRVEGTEVGNAKGPRRNFVAAPTSRADLRVSLMLAETNAGITIRGKVGGWIVDAAPHAFESLEPPVERPARPTERTHGHRARRTERDVCGRIVRSPRDHYVRPTGTRL